MTFPRLSYSGFVICCRNILKEGLTTAKGRPQVSEPRSGCLVPHLLLWNLRVRSKACLVELLEWFIFVHFQWWLLNFKAEDVLSFFIWVFGWFTMLGQQTSQICFQDPILSKRRVLLQVSFQYMNHERLLANHVVELQRFLYCRSRLSYLTEKSTLYWWLHIFVRSLNYYCSELFFNDTV